MLCITPPRPSLCCMQGTARVAKPLQPPPPSPPPSVCAAGLLGCLLGPSQSLRLRCSCVGRRRCIAPPFHVRSGPAFCFWGRVWAAPPPSGAQSIPLCTAFTAALHAPPPLWACRTLLGPLPPLGLQDAARPPPLWACRTLLGPPPLGLQDAARPPPLWACRTLLGPPPLWACRTLLGPPPFGPAGRC